MLTREFAIAAYENGQALPDRLTRRRHARYLQHAERLLDVYRRGVGRPRHELHRAVRAVLEREPDCSSRRAGAFCKLLDDEAEFDADRKGEARRRREQVFRLAAPHHPLRASPERPTAGRSIAPSEAEVKQRIAAELDLAWSEVDRRLFSDIADFQPLLRFEGYADGAALLSRYNVAQAQAVLFDAVRMTVWASADFKTIVRHVKLARLMHTISRTPEGYMLRLDGPASLTSRTRRYGTAMARFLPALLACRGWQMHAVVQPKGRRSPVRFELSPDDGLTSHLPPPGKFDSDLEATFAAEWGAAPRDGWTLAREAELLCRGQRVFFPDFALGHPDGRRALLEIVGFWTPEYLEAKLKTLALFAEEPLLLAVADSVARTDVSWPPGTIHFKSCLKIEQVLERLAAIARR
jgi:uncharacterized protein